MTQQSAWMNVMGLVIMMLIYIIGFMVIETPSPAKLMNTGVAEYRVWLHQCLKDPVLTIDICDTVWDKMHGLPQGPL